MPIFDYYCKSCDEVTETIAKPEDMLTCNACGTPLKRLITGTSFRLDGTDPDFPTEWDRWAKRHEKLAKTGDS